VASRSGEASWQTDILRLLYVTLRHRDVMTSSSRHYVSSVVVSKLNAAQFHSVKLITPGKRPQRTGGTAADSRAASRGKSRRDVIAVTSSPRRDVISGGVAELGEAYIRSSQQAVKAVCHKTASPPRTDRSIVFTGWHQCAAHPSSNTWLGVFLPNKQRLDQSAPFIELTSVTTRRRPHSRIWGLGIGDQQKRMVSE